MLDCAPDPVREAAVREGAHEAANDIGGTGRIASAPASGPSANGSQPPPDPVREAAVREGAHEAANDIGGTGRIASAPASGPSANGSQPPPDPVREAPVREGVLREGVLREGARLAARCLRTVSSRACTHLRGCIAKWAPVPRPGAYTSQGIVTKCHANSHLVWSC